MKYILGFLLSIILYLSSLIDGRAIYDPNGLVDCRIGKYIFTLEKSDCNNYLESKIKKILELR